MTRKRAIKKLMGIGYSRNGAAFFQTLIVELFGCNKAVLISEKHSLSMETKRSYKFLMRNELSLFRKSVRNCAESKKALPIFSKKLQM